MLASLSKSFVERFGHQPRVYRAPGRVNLIGEHTDYTGGLVLPAAIEFSTWAAISDRDDQRLVVFSQNFSETAEFDLDDPAPNPRGHWCDYVLGVAAMLRRAGIQVRGPNLFIASDVPIGAGLSSSAALEVAVSFALAPQLDPTERARLCQRAEHFAGIPCGIMDQFVACHARVGNAVMLDCRSMEHRYVPLPPGVMIVIANTMVRHALAAGEYERRRAQCSEAESRLGCSLRDATLGDLSRVRLPDTLLRRARHVITENARVVEAAAALNRGNLDEFGRLMYASHASLRDDYEVSCPELDTLVDIARSVPGVYGSRMTGGGFGGCTVSLVGQAQVNVLRVAIQRGYPRADVYVSDARGAAGLVRQSPVEVMDF